MYIDVLEESEPNDGEVMIIPKEFADRDHGPEIRKCEMGLIKINLTSPVTVCPYFKSCLFVIEEYQ